MEQGDSCCERVLENPTGSVCPFHAAIPVKCKPCALPFPAMPSIVHQKTRYAENRGMALSPSGKDMQQLSLDVSVSRGKRVHFFSAGHIYFSSHLLNSCTWISCAKEAISLFYPSTESTVELLLLK